MLCYVIFPEGSSCLGLCEVTERLMCSRKSTTSLQVLKKKNVSYVLKAGVEHLTNVSPLFYVRY